MRPSDPLFIPPAGTEDHPHLKRFFTDPAGTHVLTDPDAIRGTSPEVLKWMKSVESSL